MKKLFLCTALILFTFVLKAQSVAGDWHGILKVQGVQLNLIFHVQEIPEGHSATMDSPDQGAFGIPASSTQVEDGQVNIVIAAAGITYEGSYDPNTETITGTFKQGPLALPLDLSRDKKEKKKLNRPQEPVGPFPYISEEVSIYNEEAEIRLAGTLTLPDSTGNFPAVILITGSGPQDRNEEIMGHKPFLVLADHLTRNGIAVLRYDDRGYGKSEGDFGSATTEDFATDVEAAMEYLKSHKNINPEKIGLLGHSEGGIIGPMVAEDSEDVSFLVLLAGSGLRGKELMLLQKKLFEERSGASEEEVAEGQDLLAGAYDIILNSKGDQEALRADMEAYFRKNFPANVPEETVVQTIDQFTDPWFTEFIKHDPAPVLEEIEIPVLALFGEKDFQVPPKENAAVVQRSLEKAENGDFTIQILEGHNHLFQESTTGMLDEYGEIEQSFSPEALQILTQWILERTR